MERKIRTQPLSTVQFQMQRPCRSVVELRLDQLRKVQQSRPPKHERKSCPSPGASHQGGDTIHIGKEIAVYARLRFRTAIRAAPANRTATPAR